MSNIAIQGAATGTGVFTLASPATNTDRTLTLPDEAGTVLTSAGIPASAMPAGSVLQVVSSIFATSTTTTSTSYVDTGLSATITPSSTSSNILVFVNMSGMYIANAGNYPKAMLVRNSTQIGEFLGAAGYNIAGASVGAGGMSYLDSPATTSAVTYKVQILSATGQVVYWSNNSSKCTMTLMEIAA
jgi:hypothetical protein